MGSWEIACWAIRCLTVDKQRRTAKVPEKWRLVSSHCSLLDGSVAHIVAFWETRRVVPARRLGNIPVTMEAEEAGFIEAAAAAPAAGPLNTSFATHNHDGQDSEATPGA
ncbi:hypothetical protein CGLO_12561 [Colletotrichum gloeosporioides Cg-14]|uniref:Uncharacterized protein n=1 Tax=Colletotrichum gloeosporioides (strain Cg-14) TaxID=1237896 RepID=T0JYA2_COLGC|nr:hypothetical protein CGLO_12561 [Colletotrichum gloeosporioides Cg-14]